jgi:hypothetical protein
MCCGEIITIINENARNITHKNIPRMLPQQPVRFLEFCPSEFCSHSKSSAAMVVTCPLWF